jgi:hypothetical protein
LYVPPLPSAGPEIVGGQPIVATFTYADMIYAGLLMVPTLNACKPLNEGEDLIRQLRKIGLGFMALLLEKCYSLAFHAFTLKNRIILQFWATEGSHVFYTYQLVLKKL